MTSSLITGAIPALITPFDKDENNDLVAWKRWIEWHDKQSSRAVVIFGSTGEGLSLSFSEKELLLNTARKSLENTAMVVGVSTPSTEHAIIQAKQAEEHGCQAILLTTPFYVRPTQDGICQHYRKIANVTSVPIIMYTVPARTGSDVTDETIITLAQEGTIAGIKDAGTDNKRAGRVLANAPESFCYLGGNDEATLDNLAQGGAGTISVIANIIPNLMQSIISNYATNEQWSKGKFNEIQDIIEVLAANGNPQAIKYMAQSLYSIPGTLRLPLTSICDDAKSSIDKLLSTCGLAPESIKN